MAELLDLAKCVKRGTRLLDRTFPTWRRVMRRHATQFDLNNGDHCILGTLEHHLGRARVLRRKKGITSDGYDGLKQALGLQSGHAYGFNWSRGSDCVTDEKTLTALWRAEFEQ